jgi:hypothetical protein
MLLPDREVLAPLVPGLVVEPDPLPPFPITTVNSSFVAEREVNSTTPPPPPPPPRFAPPPPPPPTIKPRKVVVAAGVVHVHVPTVLNATTVNEPLVVTSGVHSAAKAEIG